MEAFNKTSSVIYTSLDQTWMDQGKGQGRDAWRRPSLYI